MIEKKFYIKRLGKNKILLKRICILQILFILISALYSEQNFLALPLAQAVVNRAKPKSVFVSPLWASILNASRSNFQRRSPLLRPRWSYLSRFFPVKGKFSPFKAVRLQEWWFTDFLLLIAKETRSRPRGAAPKPLELERL